jgi:hypothetical protein
MAANTAAEFITFLVEPCTKENGNEVACMVRSNFLSVFFVFWFFFFFVCMTKTGELDNPLAI